MWDTLCTTLLNAIFDFSQNKCKLLIGYLHKFLNEVVKLNTNNHLTQKPLAMGIEK